MAGKNLFNSVKMTRPTKNVFDLTHDVKFSGNAGKLMPVMLMECVPGDSVTIGCETLIRCAPLVSPLMHRTDATVHYFAVPYRLVWPNFEKWITNVRDEVSGLLPAFPTINVSQAWRGDDGQLPDYMGIPYPPEIDSPNEKISAIPFAMVQLIYNEFYRDQNLIDPVDYMLVDGDNTANTALKTLRYRSWEHDYFTSALPFAQKGQAVDIPLGNIKLNPDVITPGYFVRASDHAPEGTTANITADGLTGRTIQDGTDVVYDPRNTLTTEPTPIETLRLAFRLQEWLEKQARGGTRYTESILTHFGVHSSDARLQRPEYITGIKTPIIISEVLNTTGTEEAPQGNMAGRGVGIINGDYGRYFCEEHCYIIGIMSIMPKTAYQQGIDKHYLKYTDPTELFWPTFANLGEQAVLVREIFAYTALGGDTFGYLPRYAEYKFMNNRVAGQFRSSLSTWTWPRIFATEPELNQQFIDCKPDYNPFAVISENVDHFYIQHVNKVRAVRPMPKYGTPQF